MTYTNEETFFIKSIPSYTVEVATVPNQAAKWTNSELSFIGGNSTVASIRDALPVEVNTRSAGMKINVIFNDDKVFGAFDFATLLDNLTSALALIAVASIIVDFFMLMSPSLPFTFSFVVWIDSYRSQVCGPAKCVGTHRSCSPQ